MPLWRAKEIISSTLNWSTGTKAVGCKLEEVAAIESAASSLLRYVCLTISHVTHGVCAALPDHAQHRGQVRHQLYLHHTLILHYLIMLREQKKLSLSLRELQIPGCVTPAVACSPTSQPQWNESCIPQKTGYAQRILVPQSQVLGLRPFAAAADLQRGRCWATPLSWMSKDPAFSSAALLADLPSYLLSSFVFCTPVDKSWLSLLVPFPGNSASFAVFKASHCSDVAVEVCCGGLCWDRRQQIAHSTAFSLLAFKLDTVSSASPERTKSPHFL